MNFAKLFKTINKIIEDVIVLDFNKYYDRKNYIVILMIKWIWFCKAKREQKEKSVSIRKNATKYDISHWLNILLHLY